MRTLVVVSGFGEKGLDKLARSICAAVPSFDATAHIRGCPWWRALHAPEANMRRIRRLIDAIPGARFILSHSGSGHLVAATLAEDPLPDTPAVFLDGALSPYVKVGPPLGMKKFQLWARQYAGRVQLAQRCVNALEDHGAELDFYTIASSSDSIIPDAAKRLPGVAHDQMPWKGHALYPRKIETITELVSNFVSSLRLTTGKARL